MPIETETAGAFHRISFARFHRQSGLLRATETYSYVSAGVQAPAHESPAGDHRETQRDQSGGGLPIDCHECRDDAPDIDGLAFCYGARG
jgi:hypothetical protein